ncbi:hypothetical protein ACG5V6_07625 [Streptomyces chitinivorans]|uniref:DUF1963 domain-containing protein n=1 Tax=Streptomyces chitinivorans TaxID=1257027 RepID=A0ABW7HQC4_9ACTN|nr:hypothetical protein [Streptomyces chitinivorans]MDH2408503.1 hypothetical protein [Streptomyces chitinivorans]
MSRTTPPRPVDVASVFPELAPLARTAVRLHPRPGAPVADDSSVGGPLLWPADEPWPTCPEHTGPWLIGYTPEDLRTQRRILTEGWARPRTPGADFLTPDERAFIDGLGHTGRRLPVDGPVPLLPVLQLYARDVPSLPCPPGADLLQVLWCSFEHGEDCMPGVRLRWRSAGAVTEVRRTPPPTVVSEGESLPEPCLLNPEPVVEYPAPLELDEELSRRIHAWEEGRPYDYQSDLSVAPGWKLGGWGNWSFCDPWPILCEECGTRMRPFLTLDSSEWDGGTGSWRPLEEQPPDRRPLYPRPHEPTMISIGRGYTMQLYLCPVSFGHPHRQVMQ